MNTTPSLLLVGAGNMAQQYSPILEDLNINYDVVCQSPNSATNFQEKTGHTCFSGGLENLLDNTEWHYSKAIVTTGVEALLQSTVALIKSGVKDILLEKPGGMNPEEINILAHICAEHEANVFIAYNRRFYASVLTAKELIAQDGGVLSGNFEFTEWAHTIEPLKKAPGVKENWFLANSTHVVDLGFHLMGKPQEMASFTAGELNWHTPAIFSGAGRTEKNVLFSYRANWLSPGRWGVEVLTAKRKLIFQPMEKLFEQLHGSVAVNEVVIDDAIDLKFKHGLWLQTSHFVNENYVELKTIKEQKEDLSIFNRMLNQR
jgi:predicted dehydrogenase